MSVIVKGMEMPKNCFSCACASYYERLDKAMCDPTNKQLDQKVWKKERHPNCPLVEIPTPHGRLIDADAIQDYNVETFGQRLLIIDTAPTVIEAEGVTDA